MSATRWTLRDAGPSLIERGIAGTSRLLVFRGTVATAASSGTYLLTDSGGTTIVTGATTVDDTETTFALSSAATVNATLGTRYRETWTLTVSGEAVKFKRDAWIVRSVLRPVVTIEDLVRRHRDLRDLVDGGDAVIEGFLIEAWATIEADLIKKGKRTNLIMESWALRSLHVYRTLHLVFVDALTRFAGGDRYEAHAQRYADLADEEWTRNLRFDYDANEDGLADTKAAGTNVLVLTAGNMDGPYWGRRSMR